jgi:hypothetical protein
MKSVIGTVCGSDEPARVDLTVSPWSDDQCARLWLALIGRQAKIDRRSDSRDDIPESINYNN